MEKIILRNIYIVIGVTVALLIIMVGVWAKMLMSPQMEALTKAKGEYDTAKTEADKLPQALNDKLKAQHEVQFVKDQLAFLQQRFRRLSFDYQGRDINADRVAKEVIWRRWLNEYHHEYGRALSRELIAIANASDVNIKTEVKVEAPPQIPEAVTVPTNGLLKPTGATPLAIEITGRLPNIKDFLTRINRSSIFMVVTSPGIKLEGYSPDIKATFTVQPYLLAVGKNVQISAAAGTAPAGAAPAGGAPPTSAPPPASSEPAPSSSGGEEKSGGGSARNREGGGGED